MEDHLQGIQDYVERHFERAAGPLLRELEAAGRRSTAQGTPGTSNDIKDALLSAVVAKQLSEATSNPLHPDNANYERKKAVAAGMGAALDIAHFAGQCEKYYNVSELEATRLFSKYLVEFVKEWGRRN